ncbi:MAG: glycosyltransferase, partial [Geminicoccaceae bacterium]
MLRETVPSGSDEPLGSLRVMMVIESDYPSVDGGGAEAQVETLTRNRPDGVEVMVVAPLVPFGPQAVHDVVHGCPVQRIPYPTLPLIGGLIMLCRLALLIARKRREIDAVHCHIAHNMAAVACFVGWLLSLPVLVKLTGMTELENGILSDRASPALALKRWLIKHATAVQAVSEELEAGLLAKGFDPARVHRLPNAVDTRLFAPADRTAVRVRLGIEAGFIACFVGRLVPEKALDSLIRAWAKAIPADASAALVLVGTGHLEDELKVLAAELGRSSQIRFEGFVADKAVIADYWRISDVGLLTSEFEGLSNALLEAMSAGVPMIGSRVSGNTDLILPGKTGWLFQPRDIDQLKACLAEAFLMAPETRLALG